MLQLMEYYRTLTWDKNKEKYIRKEHMINESTVCAKGGVRWILLHVRYLWSGTGVKLNNILQSF